MLNYLLVLGLIPGTHIQITFYEYLLMLPLAGMLFYAHKHNRQISRDDISHYWLYARIYATTRSGAQLSLHL